MIKLLRNTGVALFLSGVMIINAVPSYSVDNGFISNIKELKELSDIMNIIKENHVGAEKDPTNTTLMQGALKGMMESLDDPHSNYFTKEELESFKEDIEGKYAGVGMVIQKKADEPLIVVSPIEDTPAYLAGIRAKDKIIAIDGESTYKLTSEQSVKKLKGEPGTSVKLTVYREEAKETKDVELKRSIIELKYVKSKMIGKDIGYLRLTQFGEDVYKDVRKDLEGLLKKGAKGIILDLRSNPGGSLGQAVKISSMFIPEGKIVSTKGKTGEEEIAYREGKYFGDFPLIVLINEGSASASEIVSGAIKDYKRGTLIGEKSFGKGSVQTLLPLPDGDGIKLTIAKYYTPSGVSIHGKGIEPDILVEEKDDFLFFNGFVTNVNEEETKENRNEIIKEVKGEEEAKKIISKGDIQLDKAVEEMNKLLEKK
ncbi:MULTISPECIES: S41 family peptidase [Cetobacterium]|jgi:carboxyl-terminal processing protease|uniref:S41 family peptidase n=1 Tax=Candidatus Cetobacterium colombiensis TaxID=3073100 RepID=A0ABU4WDJ5_9FUSO|nr:S41 family peptidase [Candidatus Cetobacterium colombiensis]MDX8336475.1 S41 family peptidase [Candidatus Cetobacterium colombiensis]